MHLLRGHTGGVSHYGELVAAKALTSENVHDPKVEVHKWLYIEGLSRDHTEVRFVLEQKAVECEGRPLTTRLSGRVDVALSQSTSCLWRELANFREIKMHDLAIRNARICDGTGQPMFDGEIAVVDGRIAEIGDRVGPARAEVDAGGQVIAPGIIDNHTHYDAQITWDPYASPTLGLGVTTLLMGNCGFTIAPCRPADREATLKNLTQVEGMSLDALLEGTSQEYESFADYMGLLQSQGVVPNVAVYCGHSSVRTWVMGDDAVKREASDREIESMKSVVTQALKDGAVGFATSSFEGHNGWGGVPMPSRFAAHEEYNRLAGSLADVGTGCFMLTKGRPTPIDYLETLAADTGAMVAVAAVVYDHANPDQAFNDMRAIGDAVDRGRRMVAQTPCTAISMDFTLRGAYLFEALNSWRPAISLYEDTEGLRKFLAERVSVTT